MFSERYFRNLPNNKIWVSYHKLRILGENEKIHYFCPHRPRSGACGAPLCGQGALNIVFKTARGNYSNTAKISDQSDEALKIYRNSNFSEVDPPPPQMLLTIKLVLSMEMQRLS